MTTWGDLLAEIRNDIDDADDPPRYSDATLFIYLKDAIRDYSTHFPQLVSRAELTLDGQSYNLPNDYIRDVRVECPLDRFLKRRQETPGQRYPSLNTRPTHYYISGGRLFTNGALLDEDGVFLTYLGLHPVPASADDNTFVLTVPDLDMELIRLYVKAKVNEKLRGQQANMDRFKLGSGNRDDNPIQPEVADLMDEYRTKIAEREPGGVIQLWRTGNSR